jgi:AraC-like DNA-binding protein
MADAAGLSRFHFSRLFQEHIGIAPGEFLRQERLRAVIRLLQSTELPLKTIAQQTGLPNAEYLSRMFRKVQGVSPRSFREANRR